MSNRSILITIVVLVIAALALVKVGPPGALYVPEREALHGSVAIVLDDFGYTKNNLFSLKGIGVPLTIAVLPDAPYTKSVCAFARKNGIEVILHLPMEPERSTESLEKDTVMTDMSDEEIRKTIRTALRKTPGAVGISNHMGSKATKDERVMEIVMDEVSKRGMFFLDSMTTSRSACGRMAREKGVPFAKRTIFIDNVLDRKAITAQLERTAVIASVEDSVVAIGHDRTATVMTLKEILPDMEKRGIRFVPLSEVVEKR